jgi:hypothetical protein
MPIPLHERAVRGFENREFVADLECRFSSGYCEEIAALFILRKKRGIWRASLDRLKVVS